MDHRNASLLSGVAAVLVLCLSADSSPAQTTKQPDDNLTLRSLLNEVHLLRQTLQRTGLNAYRSQIIVERTRAQNEQVMRVKGMLTDVRNEIEGIERNIPRMTEQAKLMESMIEHELDVNKRIELEYESKERKT